MDRNIEQGLVKFYNPGSSEYVGGLTLDKLPTSLTITQDEANKIGSMVVTLPPNGTFSLLANKDINKTVDLDCDGMPDLIQ